MPDVAISSLDTHHRLLADKAQLALTRGHWDYVVEVCTQILRAQPGCLAVRRWQREARLQLRGAGPGPMERLRDGLSLTGASLWLAVRQEPKGQLEAAERILAVNPNHGSGLKLLASAAAALKMPGTAVFAWECLRDVRPHDGATLLGLAEAFLAADRPSDALQAAADVLRQRPHDPEALSLQRRASVAETMRRGQWEDEGDYRAKLREREPAGVATTRAAAAAPGTAAPTTFTPAIGGASPLPHEAEGQLAVAQMYLDGGDTRAAIPAFQRARQNVRTRIAATVGLAGAFQQQKQWDLAIAQYREVRDELTVRHPSWKLVRYELGQCLEAAGQPEAAIDEYKMVYRVDVGYRDVAQKIAAHYAPGAGAEAD